MKKATAQKTAAGRRIKSSAITEETDSLSFWNSQALKHGPSDLATNPDQHYRRLEIERIMTALSLIKFDQILDVGCGNGHTTLEIAKAYPGATVVGVDFSPEMIKEANKHALPNVEFHVGDVLSLSRHRALGIGVFDAVVSTRCLINLANWDEQKIGILEMGKMLAADGRLILVENFKDGLANLNAIRKVVGLPPIKERWHNSYIPQDEFAKFMGSQSHSLAQEFVENIGNMYYMASRVIYAKICQDQGIEPDYDNPINAIASQLPSFGEFYACSPNFMIIFKKIAGQHGRTVRSFS